MTAQNRIVYRDGVALRVSAGGAFEAVCLSRGAEVLPLLGGQQRGSGGAPYAFAVRVRYGFEIVRYEGTHASAVYFVETVDLYTALECWLAAQAELKRARAIPTRPIVVTRYKTGKRAGQFHFTRAHSEDYRARVSADVQHNARRLASIDDAEQALAESANVVTIAAAIGEDLHAHHARVRSIVAENSGSLRRLLGPLAFDGVSARLSAALSVEQHGFGPGTLVTLLPDPGLVEGEIDYSGPGVIERAHPIEHGGNYGYEFHSREVHFDNFGLVSVSLSQLRPRESRQNQLEILSCTDEKQG